MKKLISFIVGASALFGSVAAHAQNNYVWRIVYYSDATLTTQVGRLTLYCNSDEPDLMGTTSQFEVYKPGSCG